MKALLDTSVLVPVFLADHKHHEASVDIFLHFEKRQACCSAHSLAEVYSTLTRLPGKFRISGEQVMLFLAEIRERLTLVTLTEDEYFASIQRAAIQGVLGGTIWDALLASCAVKAKADTLYTWNTKHFQQFKFIGRVKTPDAKT